ncbi:hypothetical protein PG988_006710 [Apiospora saccharicola]
MTQTVPSSTTTVTGYYSGSPPQLKRAVAAPATPSCIATQSYPPDRITSACSCFGVPAQTVSITSTAPATTVTNTNTFQATTTIEVATTHATTTLTTTSGVATVAAPATTPSPLDFESANFAASWTWDNNNPAGWSGQVVSTPSRNGQPTRAFQVVNSQNAGFGILQMVQSFYLQPGATYQLTLYVKSPAAMGAGNSATNIFAQMVTTTGYGCGGPWEPVSGGVARGNGWFLYHFSFVPQPGDGRTYSCRIQVGYTRNAATVTHLVDDFNLQKLN